MLDAQGDFYFYLILFMFASWLYFCDLSHSSLLGYSYFKFGSNVIFVIWQLGLLMTIRTKV